MFEKFPRLAGESGDELFPYTVDETDHKMQLISPPRICVLQWHGKASRPEIPTRWAPTNKNPSHISPEGTIPPSREFRT